MASEELVPDEMVIHTINGERYQAVYHGHNEVDVNGMVNGRLAPLFTLHMKTDTPTRSEVIHAMERYIATDGAEQPLDYSKQSHQVQKHWYFR